MATTKEQILERLNAYRKCELAILNGAQKYRIDRDKEFTKADLAVVQAMITKLENELDGLGGDTDIPTGYVKKTMRSTRAFFRRY